ncbi:hypothetical protein ACFWN2_00870 [Lentzea sp. NPDC058436]|uniref:hypothetical protein n=1 Tax=Lentzea sp. NPDC058436 TaxID=3346499 RepID=UPI00364EB5EB
MTRGVVTIGVHGFDEKSFLQALHDGLQAAFAGAGIAYVHHPELAPPSTSSRYAEEIRAAAGRPGHAPAAVTQPRPICW